MKKLEKERKPGIPDDLRDPYTEHISSMDSQAGWALRDVVSGVRSWNAATRGSTQTGATASGVQHQAHECRCPCPLHYHELG